MTPKITTNKKDELYIIPCGKGFTCLGFDVCLNRLNALAKEMGEEIKPVKKGSLKAYKEYNRLIDIARDRNQKTGWRSQSELIPEFIGREGQRVEVVTSYGETERYYIGKSTGFTPCHLQLSKSNSTGGGAVTGYPFKAIRFLNKYR